jgi:hypothetical protein
MSTRVGEEERKKGCFTSTVLYNKKINEIIRRKFLCASQKEKEGRNYKNAVK